MTAECWSNTFKELTILKKACKHCPQIQIQILCQSDPYLSLGQQERRKVNMELTSSERLTHQHIKNRLKR